jgi:hypothetical protein
LIAREAGECRSILTTIKRFLGPGASLHGMVFNAEAARRQFAEGIPPALAHIPAGLRTFAADFGQDSRIGGSEGTIEKLVERLWSDEALGRWLNTGSGSLNLKPSLKNPHLAHFRVTI